MHRLLWAPSAALLAACATWALVDRIRYARNPLWNPARRRA